MRSKMMPCFGAALFLFVLLLLPSLAIAQGPPNIKYTVAGHAGDINSLAVAPNNLCFASASSDGTIKLWKMADGTLLHTLSTGKASSSLVITSIAISADSQTIVSAGSDSVVREWNMSDGSENLEFSTGVSYPYAVALSPDGKIIAVGGSNSNGGGRIDLYNAATGTYITSLVGQTSYVTSVAFAPTNASLLVSGSADLTARVWNLTTHTYTVLSGHTQQVNAVAFSPVDPTIVVTGSSDGTARIWHLKSGVSWMTLNAQSYGVWSVAFTPNGKIVLTGGSSPAPYVVEAWSTATGTLTSTITTNDFTQALAPLSDNATFFSGGRNQQIYQFRIADGTLLRSFGSYTAPLNLIVAPNGQEIATSETNQGGWRQNVADGSFLQSIAGVPVAYSQDSQYLFVRYLNGTNAIRKIPSGQNIRVIPGSVNAATFQLDGKSLVVWNTNGIQWFRIVDGALLHTFATPSGNQGGVFSADGTQLALGDSSGAVYIYRVADGTLLTTLKSSSLGSVSQIAWSTDATTLAALSTSNVTVFRVADGSVQGNYSPPQGVTYGQMALSPLGDVVAIYRNEDNSLEVDGIYINQETFYDQELGTGANALAFSANANLLFVGRNDATLMALYNPYPISLSSVAVNPTTAQGGLVNPTGTVTLNQAAPTGGVGVQLSVSDPTVVSVQSSVLVAKGNTTATFIVTTKPVTTNTMVTLYATYNGHTTSTILNVEPNTAVQSLTLAPAFVTGGFASIGFITLGQKAGATGIIVPLTCSDPSVTIPATVTVPAFKKNVAFPIITSNVTAQKVVTITATHGGVTQSATLTVNPVAVASLALYPNTISGGDDTIGMVTLTAPAPADTLVTLKSNAPNLAAPVSTTITIPAGSQTGLFYILSNSVTATKKVNITAQANGTATATLTLTP